MSKRKGIRGRSVHRTEVVVDRQFWEKDSGKLRHDRQVCCGRKLRDGSGAKKKMMTLDPCMGVTPRPSWEAPWVADSIFGCGCKRGFHSSTFYFTLHLSAYSLAFWENLFDTV